MATTQSYKEKLLPQSGENKAAYLQRIDKALAVPGTDKKDKALLLASKAVATAWNMLDGAMINPFAAGPGDNPEMLEGAVVLMAEEIRSVIPDLDELRNPKQRIADAMHDMGARGRVAGGIRGIVRSQAKEADNRAVREVLRNVNSVFSELIDYARTSESAQEREVLDALQPIYKDFREIRRDILDARRK